MTQDSHSHLYPPLFPHCPHLLDPTNHSQVYPASITSILCLSTTTWVIKCSHSCDFVPTGINQFSLRRLPYFQQSLPCPVLSVLCSPSNPSPILPSSVCGVLFMRQPVPGGKEHGWQCRLSLGSQRTQSSTPNSGAAAS